MAREYLEYRVSLPKVFYTIAGDYRNAAFLLSMRWQEMLCWFLVGNDNGLINRSRA